MAGVTFAQPAFYVRWSCRRCGHTGGLAKSNIPINPQWNEAMMRTLFDSLRTKLVQIHARGQGCLAAHGDFMLERGCPEDAEIVGLV